MHRLNGNPASARSESSRTARLPIRTRGSPPGAHRRQHRRTVRAVEDRERRVQHPQEPRLPPGAQLRPRPPAPVGGVLRAQPAGVLHAPADLVDGLYQRVRTFFTRRAFWDEVRSAFRLFLFTSWDQVLARMNSPPEPLPAPVVPEPVACMPPAAAARGPPRRETCARNLRCASTGHGSGAPQGLILKNPVVWPLARLPKCARLHWAVPLPSDRPTRRYLPLTENCWLEGQVVAPDRACS